MPGLRFLALKTPLDSKFNENVPEECRFSPGMLIDGVDDLGLIIDLSKTDRWAGKINFLSYILNSYHFFFNSHQRYNF